MTNLCVLVSVVLLKLVLIATTVPDGQLVFSVRNGSGQDTRGVSRHAFFRGPGPGPGPGPGSGPGPGPGAGSRRVFGGAAAELAEFPAACALLDRYWAVRCSATVLAPRWVLTAAHCVTPAVTYVKYNTRRPASSDGNVTAVRFLYRHPKYKVEQKDEGRGLDVTTLHHDVGLVRTRDAIELPSELNYVLNNLQLIDPYDLCSKNVKVLGFGRTEKSVLGEELFAVELQLVGCERADWLHCVCGVGPEPRGVCAGDSGGPALCGGVPIAVTSMGPVECALGGAPPAGATSVMTALPRYAALISDTILDTEAALRMRVISAAGRPHRTRCPQPGAGLLLLSWNLLLNY